MWETRTPEQVGMEPAGVQAAIKHALASENTRNPRDQEFATKRASVVSLSERRLGRSGSEAARLESS